MYSKCTPNHQMIHRNMYISHKSNLNLELSIYKKKLALYMLIWKENQCQDFSIQMSNFTCINLQRPHSQLLQNY